MTLPVTSVWITRKGLIKRIAEAIDRGAPEVGFPIGWTDAASARVLAAIVDAGCVVIEAPKDDPKAPGWHIVVAAIRAADLAREPQKEG